MTLQAKLTELISSGDLTEEGAEQVKSLIFDLLTVQQSQIYRELSIWFSQRIPRI